MKHSADIHKKVEEALSGLDGIQRANPSPFFYTRLQAKLKMPEKNVWENIGSYISRPVVAFATIIFILLLNTAALYKNNSGTISTLADPNEQVPTNAYDVTSNTNSTILNLWNQENEQPFEK